MQRDVGGKLYFTAPWDFDFGFGTYGPATSNWGLVSTGSEGCPWYGELLLHEWFVEEVLARMKELDDVLTETLQAVRDKAKEIEGAADANAYFWNMYGRSFHAYVSSQVSRYLDSYEEHIDFLVDWTVERWENMKTHISEYL